jgi:hypothetical protein
MSTTHKLPYTRFTRQAILPDVALLATGPGAMQTGELIKSGAWVEQSEQQASFPPRMTSSQLSVPAEPEYDAYKYISDYADGKNDILAGMVAYRFTVPADALTSGTEAEIVSLDVPVFVDRWLVDGVRVAACLSDTDVPPEDWDTLREGDVYLAAQLPMLYTDDDPPERIVEEKDDTLTLTFAASTTAQKYIYVILSLEDYTTVRDFWVEGSALALGQLSETLFSRSVDEDPPPQSQVAIKQLRMTSSRKRVRYTSGQGNIYDPVLLKDWGAKMLTSGNGAEGVAVDGQIMSPRVSISGADVTADGYIVGLHNTKNSIAGKALWLTVDGNLSGDSPVRLSLYSGTEPAYDAASTWRGVDSIGTQLYRNLADQQEISLAITGDNPTGDLWLVASIEYATDSDGSGASGWTSAKGISLVDAHISELRYDGAGLLPEVIGYDADAAELFLPYLRNTPSGAVDFRYYTALASHGAAYREQTNYEWATGAPVAYVSWLTAGDCGFGTGSYVVMETTHSTGNMLIAQRPGANLHADLLAAESLGTNCRYPLALDRCIAYLDTNDSYTVKFQGESAPIAYYPVAATWTNVNPGYIYTSGVQVLLWREAEDTCHVDGVVSSAAVSAVGALAGVDGMATPDTHIIALHTDGTVSVINNTDSPLYDTDLSSATSAWTGVVGIAGTRNAVYGWKADGSVLRAGDTSFVDWTEVDAREVLAITGSAHQRVCFRCSL